MTAIIHVPDIDGPAAQLCWTQKLDPPHALTRCDRKAGHHGKHSWESEAAVPVQDALTTLLKELRDLNGHEAVYLSGEFVSKDCVDDIADRIEAALRREPPAVRTEKD